VIGLEPQFASPDWTELKWRDATVALHGGGAEEERESGLGFEVDHLDAALTEVEAAGGRIGKERSQAGTYLVAIVDTEGNSLTLRQQIHRRTGPKPTRV
jgi:predicted enzyme related to lactoylglutathione lyase